MIPAKYWSPTKKLMLLGAMAGGKAVEDTATGNPLIFLTDLARPLKSLLIPFTPIQEGSGDPSPENVRPITGWTGVNVSHSGKNVLQGVVKNLKNLSGNNGVFTNTETDTRSNAQIRIEAYNGNTYLGQFANKSSSTPKIITTVLDTASYPTMNRLMITHYGSSKDFEALFEWVLPKGKYTLQFNLTGADVQTVGGFSFDSVMVEAGEVTPSTYEPYNGIVYPLSWSSEGTVYGGYVDLVTGVLTVTMVARTYDGTEENWSNQSTNVTTRAIGWDAVRGAKIGDNRIIACNRLKPSNLNQDEAPINGILNTTQTRNIRLRVSQDAISFEDFRAFLQENPVTVVCPLDTPREIQLTPQQITALVGNNTIWSDANGEMAAIYFKKA